MFMSPCIVLIFWHIIPNRYTIHRVYFYVTTALHVSGVTITHSQEHKTTVTTASGNRYTVLLSVAIVEESELISSDSSTIATALLSPIVRSTKLL